MNTSRKCAECDGPLVLTERGYVHASGRDGHVPVPIIRIGNRSQAAYDKPSTGHKRPSGSAALFTDGDGR